MAPDSVVWRGVVWRGVAFSGVAWCGLITDGHQVGETDEEGGGEGAGGISVKKKQSWREGRLVGKSSGGSSEGGSGRGNEGGNGGGSWGCVRIEREGCVTEAATGDA